jgi:hypothetical protein
MILGGIQLSEFAFCTKYDLAEPLERGGGALSGCQKQLATATYKDCSTQPVGSLPLRIAFITGESANRT